MANEIKFEVCYLEKQVILNHTNQFIMENQDILNLNIEKLNPLDIESLEKQLELAMHTIDKNNLQNNSNFQVARDFLHKYDCK